MAFIGGASPDMSQDDGKIDDGKTFLSPIFLSASRTKIPRRINNPPDSHRRLREAQHKHGYEK
jgi:hypothetical protein